MKSLVISFVLLGLMAAPVYAQDATASASPTPSPSPQVQGLYDDIYDATGSASVSATPRPTPVTRTTTYSASETPVAGVVENTIALFCTGVALIFVGIRFSRS